MRKFKVRSITALGLVALSVMNDRPAAAQFGNEKAYGWVAGVKNIFTGDFNGDKKWDIGVTGSFDTPQNQRYWYIRYGDGNGNFDAETNHYWGNGYTNVFTGDFDGDGKWDIGVTPKNNEGEQNQRYWYIRYGDGAGNFGRETNFYWGNGATSVVTGDFNKDGKWDIGVVDGGDAAATFYLRYGNGNGSFGQDITVSWAGAGYDYWFTGDFDGDGYSDIGAASPSVLGTWKIRLNQRNGTFGAETRYDWKTSPRNNAIFTGDFNGDRRWDIGVTGDTTEPYWYIRFSTSGLSSGFSSGSSSGDWKPAPAAPPRIDLSGVFSNNNLPIVGTNSGAIVGTNSGAIVGSNTGAIQLPPGAVVEAEGLRYTVLPNGQIQISQNGNIVALGGGNIVAVGGANIVAVGGANIVAVGGANIVAVGGANIISAGGGNLAPGNATIKVTLISDKGLGFNGPGGGNVLVAGAGIVALGGGNLQASLSELSQNVSNIVALGGGNFSDGIARIVALGGGNLMPNINNIVALGGGNFAEGAARIVALGGGNLVTGVARIVALGGGNFSTPGTANSARGFERLNQEVNNIVALGGGNFRQGLQQYTNTNATQLAQDIGNLISKDSASLTPPPNFNFGGPMLYKGSSVKKPETTPSPAPAAPPAPPQPSFSPGAATPSPAVVKPVTPPSAPAPPPVAVKPAPAPSTPAPPAINGSGVLKVPDGTVAVGSIVKFADGTEVGVNRPGFLGIRMKDNTRKTGNGTLTAAGGVFTATLEGTVIGNGPAEVIRSGRNIYAPGYDPANPAAKPAVQPVVTPPSPPAPLPAMATPTPVKPVAPSSALAAPAINGSGALKLPDGDVPVGSIIKFADGTEVGVNRPGYLGIRFKDNSRKQGNGTLVATGGTFTATLEGKVISQGPALIIRSGWKTYDPAFAPPGGAAK